VVVAVGLALVEPFAEVEVNVPGAMPMLVAPDVSQVSVLLVPESTLSGFAAKEAIVGRAPFPDDEFEAIFDVAPQPVMPAQTSPQTISRRPRRAREKMRECAAGLVRNFASYSRVIGMTAVRRF
jgi:hypothetical protein